MVGSRNAKGKAMSEHQLKLASHSPEIARRDFFKLAGVSVAALALGSSGVTLLPEEAFAASKVKCYTIKNANLTVYSNTALSKKYGTIYGSDEITVNKVTDKYCKVTYPLTKGGTKTGYISTSAILTKTSGSQKKATAKINTYKRAANTSYGYISKDDTVKVLGTSGSYTQVKYPVSGGYKYAFIKTSDTSKLSRIDDDDDRGNTGDGIAASTVASIMNAKVGNASLGAKYNGMCLKFVADCWKEMGFTRSSSCCATKYGAAHRKSSSMSNIPVGADVFFTGSGSTCGTCKRRAGHVGIYVGDGFMVHCMSGKIRKDKVSAIAASNTLNYYGWGYHGNVTIK